MSSPDDSTTKHTDVRPNQALLVRRPKDLEWFIDVVEQAKAKVATVTAGHFDLGTPTGRATARTVTAWANFESEHKAERIRRKLDELAAAGKVTNGGPRPFGFLPDRVSIDEAEAKLIREVASGAPLRAVTRRWNEAGVTTSTGGPWTGPGAALDADEWAHRRAQGAPP
ncbi:MAG: recombinase family protein [Actinomycetota bacterium]|nr:recombinase family protein [Actinomycetota bacterium]